jgi:hypothetical protein
MNKDRDSKGIFKFLDAQPLVKRVKGNPAILAAHNTALHAGALPKYHLSRVEIKTFTYASGSQSLSIDNAVLGTLPNRLLFTMIRNTDFLGSEDKNPYTFRHYDISYFSLFVNGTQIPSGGISLDTGREKTIVMCYRSLF